MGQSIHFFVERRVGDQWIHCLGSRSDPEDRGEFCSILRGRRVFTALNGVPEWCEADGVTAVDGPPKGLPIDVSPEVAEARSYADAECYASWHLLETFSRYPWATLGESGREMMAVLDDMRQLGTPDDVRAVFWFSD